MHSLRHFAAVIICFLLISLSVASAQDKPQAPPDEGRSRPISEPQQGSKAPDFTLKSVSGESVRLSDFWRSRRFPAFLGNLVRPVQDSYALVRGHAEQVWRAGAAGDRSLFGR